MGQTVKSISSRFSGHLIEKNMSLKTKWINQLRGLDLIPEIVLVKECHTDDRTNFAERFYIKLFGQRRKGTGVLLNSTDGGNGKLGYEGYLKIKEQNKKRLLGTKQSPEFIEKRISKIRGMKRTPEFKKYISDLQKQRFKNGELKNFHVKGTKLSEERRQFIIKTNTGRKKTTAELILLSDRNSKINVLQYDLKGNFVKTYKGMRQAARETGLTYVLIRRSCESNGRKTHKGFRFIKETDLPLKHKTECST